MCVSPHFRQSEPLHGHLFPRLPLPLALKSISQKRGVKELSLWFLSNLCIASLFFFLFKFRKHLRLNKVGMITCNHLINSHLAHPFSIWKAFWVLLSFVFETGSHVAQTTLQLSGPEDDPELLILCLLLQRGYRHVPLPPPSFTEC